jgi:hypothetical protein
MTRLSHICALIGVSLLGHSFVPPAAADEGARLLRVDHYVGVRSTVPAIVGQVAPIYARARGHRVLTGTLLHGVTFPPAARPHLDRYSHQGRACLRRF